MNITYKNRGTWCDLGFGFATEVGKASYAYLDLETSFRVLSIRNKKKSILLLSGFIAAVVLDKAHNLVRKGFPAGFAEMDMNVKGRAADVLHKVGFGGQRGSGCGGAGFAGFIIHRLLLSMRKAPYGSTWGGD